MTQRTTATLLSASMAIAASAQTNTLPPKTTQDGFILILILTLLIVSLGHMIYVLFIRRKLRTDWTVDQMIARRAKANLPLESDPENDARAFDLIINELNSWETIYTSTGEATIPLKRSKVKKAAKTYSLVVAMMPTNDEGVLHNLNIMADALNDMRKRSFTASKTMLVVIVLFSLLFGYLTNNWGEATVICLANAGYYSLSCMRPAYVLIRKELNGSSGGSFLTGVIFGLLGSVAAAPVYRTVTKWSDGRTETQDDHSATLFSLILAVIMTMVLVIFLPAISFINYLRNYVFA